MYFPGQPGAARAAMATGPSRSRGGPIAYYSQSWLTSRFVSKYCFLDGMLFLYPGIFNSDRPPSTLQTRAGGPSSCSPTSSRLLLIGTTAKLHRVLHQLMIMLLHTLSHTTHSVNTHVHTCTQAHGHPVGPCVRDVRLAGWLSRWLAAPPPYDKYRSSSGG